MTDYRYPIGRFQFVDAPTEAERKEWIEELEHAPAAFRKAVSGLSPGELDTPYRNGGWTVRQVVHHMADSHLNGYIRFRLALTEDEPAIKGYDEKEWANLVDARTAPVEISLTLLGSLHQRWVALLRSLSTADFEKTFIHHERGAMALAPSLGLYAWHGRHHAAHITSLRERMGWK